MNEGTIGSIYFRDLFPLDNTNIEKHMESVKETEMLIDLFISYLRDNKIPRYIKILID